MELVVGKAYTIMFNGATDAVELLNNGCPEQAKSLLMRCQRMAEEQFMNDNTPIQFGSSSQIKA